MSNHNEEIRQLAKEFENCRKILLALGDENRQHLMLEMMRMGDCKGVRIGTITEKSNLSRPAVSHHIQILKDAGILKMRREGTKNYYYFDRRCGRRFRYRACRPFRCGCDCADADNISACERI